MTAFLSKLAATAGCLCVGGILLTFRADPQQTPQTTTLVVTVTDKKDGPVSSLAANEFVILNKTPIQQITASNQNDTPVSVAIVFDFSGSMGEGRDNKASKRTQRALASLVRFVQGSNPANEYFLIGFNTSVRSFRERFQDPHATIADLNAMADLHFLNGAALYDALQLALNKLSQRDLPKRAILLVTDSDDSASHATFKETIHSIELSNALVYPVFLLPDDYSDTSGGSALTNEARSILKEFASVSGGRYLQIQGSQEVNGLVDQIAAELRSQYFLNVTLVNNLHKKCYDVKLKLAPEKPELKSLSMRSRKVICIS